MSTAVTLSYDVFVNEPPQHDDALMEPVRTGSRGCEGSSGSCGDRE
jgi:hypothetical protein